MNKRLIAKRLITIAKQIIADVIVDVNSAAEKIKSGIKAPFVSVKTSTLGGEERATITLLVSLDEKKDWRNGILENSRYFRMSINKDGAMEVFSGGTRKLKFRKTKAKSVEEVITKINNHVEELQKLPNTW